MIRWSAIALVVCTIIERPEVMSRVIELVLSVCVEHSACLSRTERGDGISP